MRTQTGLPRRGRSDDHARRGGRAPVHGRLVVAVGLLLLLTALAPAAPAAAAPAEVLTSRGTSAVAQFNSVEGCVAQSLYIMALQNGNRTGAVVLVNRRDRCTGALLLFGGAGGYDFPVAFSWDARLTSAELHGVVSVPDLVSGATVPVRVDIVWVGAGELLRDQSHFRYEDEGVLFTQHQNGSIRAATAAGTASAGATALIPVGTAGAGWISWSNYGQVVYQLPER